MILDSYTREEVSMAHDTVLKFCRKKHLVKNDDTLKLKGKKYLQQMILFPHCKIEVSRTHDTQA